VTKDGIRDISFEGGLIPRPPRIINEDGIPGISFENV